MDALHYDFLNMDLSLCHRSPIISLKDDDLAGRMGLQLKELNKIMAVLETDRLVRMYVSLRLTR